MKPVSSPMKPLGRCFQHRETTMKPALSAFRFIRSISCSLSSLPCSPSPRLVLPPPSRVRPLLATAEARSNLPTAMANQATELCQSPKFIKFPPPKSNQTHRQQPLEVLHRSRPPASPKSRWGGPLAERPCRCHGRHCRLQGELRPNFVFAANKLQKRVA